MVYKTAEVSPHCILRYYSQNLIECCINSAQGEDVSNSDITLVWRDDNSGKTIVTLEILCPINIIAFQLVLDAPSCDHIGLNGYQTWTESGWYKPSHRQRGLRRILDPINNKYNLYHYGDYTFYDYNRKDYHLHSYHFIEFINKDIETIFWSLSEQDGFSLFEYSNKLSKLCISKETPKVSKAGDKYSLQIYTTTGKQADVWKAIASQHKKPRLAPAPSVTGWTSWYNYYTNINAEIIEQNINAIKVADLSLDVFQIDDGWQKAVGDWSVNGKFPDGLQRIVSQVRSIGMKPGLWLAPFIAEEGSDLYKCHKDWFQKDDKGNCIQAGFSNGWSGNFYVLDFDNNAVIDYLTQVFDTVTNAWGFEFLKLDFLYAVCILPKANETRGSRMYRAMQLIRKMIGDTTLLACGVPLASAAGIADFCRVSADIDLRWESFFLRHVLRYQERVSTRSAIVTSLFRSRLDGIFFQNDPDVFLLRPENNRLTLEEKQLLLLVNKIVGSLVFTSDNVQVYTASQVQLVQALQSPAINITSFTPQDKVLLLQFSTDKEEYTLSLSLSNKSFELRDSSNKVMKHPFRIL